MGFFGNNKQRQAWVFVTYPIAAFVVFACLAAVSVYVHTIMDRPRVDDTHAAHTALARMHVLRDDAAQHTAPPAIMDDDMAYHTAHRLAYQPVRTPDAQDLVVPTVTSGVVLDVGSGIILWEKNSTARRSVASVTKLVTAMIVIDRVQDIDMYVRVPESVIRIEGTRVGCPTSVLCTTPRLEAGEEVRVRDLLSAMLMFSANDAATALAIHVAGDEEQFATLMNARMKELGAGNSHFCRPSGLEYDANEEQCYSSAYDMARVMVHLLQYDKYAPLWKMMQTETATFMSRDGAITHELENTNRLIGEMPNLIGAKTGFTPRAGYCLALASHDGTQEHRVVSVVLNDPQRFIDVRTMSDWAFTSFEWR